MPPNTTPRGSLAPAALLGPCSARLSPWGSGMSLSAPQDGSRVAHVYCKYARKKRVSRGRARDLLPVRGARGLRANGLPTVPLPLPQCLLGGPQGIRGPPVLGFPWLNGVGLAGFGLPGEAAALRIPEEEADAHQGADPGVRPRRPRQRRLLLSLRTGRHPRRGTVTPGGRGGDIPGVGCWGGGGDAAGVRPVPTQPWCPPRHGAHPGTESKPAAASLGVLRVLRALGGASWPPGVPRELSVPAWEPLPGCAPTSPRVNWGATPPHTPPGAVGAAAEVVRTTFNKTQ